MLNPLTGDPQLDKDLIEERQRELLQEAEADRIAEGDRVEDGAYRPVTDDAGDFVDSTDNNQHIHGDERSS